MPYRKTAARLEHARQMRESILDAAADVLRTDGLESLTVRRVVERAGSSIGAYYHHFADKEELLAALVDRLADRIAQKVDQTVDADVRTRLKQMVQTGITVVLEERALAQVLFASDSGDRVPDRVRKRFVDRTTAFFTREPVGVSKTMDPRLIAVLWQGSILMLVAEIVRGELAVDGEEAARLCAEWNVRALGDG